MKNILKILGGILFCFLVFWFETIFSFILPWPFDKINIIIISLVLWLFWFDSGIVVWLSFLLYFFLELYTLNSLFGLTIFSGVFSSLVLFWFYKNIFTNKSMLSVCLLTILTVTIYNFFYFILYLLSINFSGGEMFNLVNYFVNYFFEMFLSVFFIAILFLSLSRFNKNFNAKIIKKKYDWR